MLTRPIAALRPLSVLALLFPLALAGCSTLGSTPATPVSSAAGSAPADQPELARFYTQQIDWSTCGRFECGTLEVPIDYADPKGKTIKLALAKSPARSTKNGSIVINPGGPGGSGVDYLKGGTAVSPQVQRAFDVVGFDPRGVGESAGIECLDPKQMDTFLGTDPTPDDAAERTALIDATRTLGEACKTKVGPLLAHMSTADAARDMDVLRAALGDAKLNYLGKSYGTYLGAVYAKLFPKNVGRFVLDGALAPDLTSEEFNLGQAEGFDTATKAWAQNCVDEGKCPLGDTQAAVISSMESLIEGLDSKPVPVAGQPDLNQAWGSMGVALAMYDQGGWSYLTDALEALQKGDGSQLMSMGQQYAERTPAGSYSGNMMQAIYAVNCADHVEPSGMNERLAMEKRLEAKAPIWGKYLAWGSAGCSAWPYKATKDTGRIEAKGSDPIVVIGTTRDPATPYQWAVRLAKQLQSGRLITFDGDGHTAYGRSNSCVDDAVDTLFLTGKAPESDLSC